MKNKIIHYLLPTYDPIAFYKNVIGRIDLYLSLKDFISFGVNFQAPWTEEQITEVKTIFEKNGLDFRYSFNTYTKEDYRFTLLQIREDCAKLNPTARYYCEIDDDIEYFCSADTYTKLICNIIQYMEKYQVGACMIAKEPIKKCKNNYILPLRSNTWTGFGLFKRNIHENGHLFPEWYINKWGCNEDNLPAVFSLINGFETAIVGADIANHTMGYKDKTTQTANKFGLQACRKLPGTNSYFLAYNWNRYFASEYKLDFYTLLSKKRPSNIKSMQVDYKTAKKIQLENLYALYNTKAMDIVKKYEKKHFCCYNIFNYKYMALDFITLKTELLDNLYLFKGVADFCSFSINFVNITPEQLQYTIDIFNNVGISLYYSLDIAENLNTHALIQKSFSLAEVDKTGILANTNKIIMLNCDSNVFNQESEVLTIDQKISLFLKSKLKNLLV